uniref:Uncharacterized protein n=1 Tax=Knipowitschia caucasica TaxID=637954 RepID=A0AAV2JZ47_KNICA
MESAYGAVSFGMPCVPLITSMHCPTQRCTTTVSAYRLLACCAQCGAQHNQVDNNGTTLGTWKRSCSTIDSLQLQDGSTQPHFLQPEHLHKTHLIAGEALIEHAWLYEAVGMARDDDVILENRAAVMSCGAFVCPVRGGQNPVTSTCSGFRGDQG